MDLEAFGGATGIAALITAAGGAATIIIGGVAKVVGSVVGAWQRLRAENDDLEEKLDRARADRRQAEDDRDRYRRRLARYEDPDGAP